MDWSKSYAQKSLQENLSIERNIDIEEKYKQLIEQIDQCLDLFDSVLYMIEEKLYFYEKYGKPKWNDNNLIEILQLYKNHRDTINTLIEELNNISPEEKKPYNIIENRINSVLIQLEEKEQELDQLLLLKINNKTLKKFLPSPLISL